MASELRRLRGVSQVTERNGAVSFMGDREALYRANLMLRCATRVLCTLADEPCRGPEDLYRVALAVPWEDYLSPGGTLRVSAHGRGPGLENSMFAALRVKDALVDRFRGRFGRRPSVNLEDPDLRVNVQLYEHHGPRVALALDSSAEPLHQRGYRRGAGEAPLKETLAAAIVETALARCASLLSGERPPPIVDLCCGSGTLLIEAGMHLLRMPPGRARPFGFQRWLDFDARLWQRLRDEAQAQALPYPAQPFLFGNDQDPQILQAAQANARRAGLVLSTRCGDLSEMRPPLDQPPGLVLCNPPYGERLGDEAALGPLYRAMGDTLKQHFRGWQALIFTASLPLSRQIGLRPTQRIPLYNGPLEGRLLHFDLY